MICLFQLYLLLIRAFYGIEEKERIKRSMLILELPKLFTCPMMKMILYGLSLTTLTKLKLRGIATLSTFRA